MCEPWLPASARSSHSTPRQLLVAGSSHRKIANPLPNGTYAFASTTLLLSLYNLHVQEVQVPNGVLTLSLMFGGMSQLLAGLWEFASGNTFGGTLFVSYGCFWWGYSISEFVGCAGSQTQRLIGRASQYSFLWYGRRIRRAAGHLLGSGSWCRRGVQRNRPLPLDLVWHHNPL